MRPYESITSTTVKRRPVYFSYFATFLTRPFFFSFFQTCLILLFLCVMDDDDDDDALSLGKNVQNSPVPCSQSTKKLVSTLI